MDVVNQIPIKASGRGGRRANAGRPPGRRDNATLEKLAVKKEFDQRVMRLTDSLINAQALIATGQTFLFKIEKEWIKTGNKKDGGENGYWRNKKPVQVTSQDEIEQYLEEIVDRANGDLEDEHDPSATYYYLTAKEPNNMAIDSLQNRVHGKPKESLGIDIDVKFSLKGLSDRRKVIEMGKVDLIDEENNLLEE